MDINDKDFGIIGQIRAWMIVVIFNLHDIKCSNEERTNYATFLLWSCSLLAFKGFSFHFPSNQNPIMWKIFKVFAQSTWHQELKVTFIKWGQFTFLKIGLRLKSPGLDRSTGRGRKEITRVSFFFTFRGQKNKINDILTQQFSSLPPHATSRLTFQL